MDSIEPYIYISKASLHKKGSGPGSPAPSQDLLQVVASAPASPLRSPLCTARAGVGLLLLLLLLLLVLVVLCVMRCACPSQQHT